MQSCIARWIQDYEDVGWKYKFAMEASVKYRLQNKRCCLYLDGKLLSQT